MNNEHILSYETVPKITFIGEMVDILFCRAILCMQYVLGVHDWFWKPNSLNFYKIFLLQARSGAQNPVTDRAGESDDKIMYYTFLVL